MILAWFPVYLLQLYSLVLPTLPHHFKKVGVSVSDVQVWMSNFWNCLKMKHSLIKCFKRFLTAMPFLVLLEKNNFCYDLKNCFPLQKEKNRKSSLWNHLSIFSTFTFKNEVWTWIVLNKNTSFKRIRISVDVAQREKGLAPWSINRPRFKFLSRLGIGEDETKGILKHGSGCVECLHLRLLDHSLWLLPTQTHITHRTRQVWCHSSPRAHVPSLFWHWPLITDVNDWSPWLCCEGGSRPPIALDRIWRSGTVVNRYPAYPERC